MKSYPPPWGKILCVSSWILVILCASAAFTRNGFKYEVLTEKGTWSQARIACRPADILWLSDPSEIAWVASSALKDVYGVAPRAVWTGARSGTDRWPNGQPFSAAVRQALAKPGLQAATCLVLHFQPEQFRLHSCEGDSENVICKEGSTGSVITAPVRSSVTSSPRAAGSLPTTAAFFFKSVRSDRQKSTELQVVTEASLVACAARCQATPTCCAFEQRQEDSLCRLMTAPRGGDNFEKLQIEG